MFAVSKKTVDYRDSLKLRRVACVSFSDDFELFIYEDQTTDPSTKVIEIVSGGDDDKIRLTVIPGKV